MGGYPNPVGREEHFFVILETLSLPIRTVNEYSGPSLRQFKDVVAQTGSSLYQEATLRAFFSSNDIGMRLEQAQRMAVQTWECKVYIVSRSNPMGHLSEYGQRHNMRLCTAPTAD